MVRGIEQAVEAQSLKSKSMISISSKKRGMVVLQWIVLLLLPVYSNCQSTDSHLEMDDNIVSNLDSTAKSALETWEKYLINKNNSDSVKIYWSEEEKIFFGSRWVDIRYRYLDFSPSRNMTKFYKPFLLGIEKLKDDKYAIKNLYYHYTGDNKKLIVPYVYNINVVKERGRFVLQSALYSNLQKAELKRFGTITGYVFEQNSKYNLNSIQIIDSINNDFAVKYGCDPIDVKLILTESTAKMMQVSGYDYERTMYYSKQSNAFSEPANNLIFISGSDENFLHELCHLYTSRLYSPNLTNATYHNFIDEGVSTLFGGSVGLPLSTHLKKIHSFNKKYPIDFVNLAELRGGIDNITFYNCAVGGLLCKIMYDREGMDGIHKMLKGGSSDENLYKTIENLLKVKRENLNEFIHTELEKYAK